MRTPRALAVRSRGILSRCATVCALIAIVAGCSASNGAPTEAVRTTTTIALMAPTQPSLVIDDQTGLAVGPGVTEASETTVETTTTVLAITTLPPGPTTTLPNKGGPNVTLESNEELPTLVAFTAKDIYRAAITRDYERLAIIIGDRKFRWGFVGQRKPAAQWQQDYNDGVDDQVKRIITLLETPPGVDDRGNTLWPRIAMKKPEDWTIDDDAVAASLGFQPENIMETKLKGRYVDYRLVIDAEGIWTGMYLGG